ncbi:MAG: hypothetical protein BRC44_07585 [Cyanobacteria bacterium QS_4_48_99]|nr:MAG: hypothetical protein BRC44_07585 [Cyanobacteria bacterium QS_4_48_99]
MDEMLERSRELKQTLIEFVLEAEGELAESLESHVAAKSRTLGNRYDASFQRNLVIDSFITEGEVAGKTPLDLFLEHNPELPDRDRALVKSWQHSFMGLFAVKKILRDGFELMNWLTAKHYTVKPSDPATLEEMARFKEEEILLARIAPVTETEWMFSGSYLPLGRLGKPKLAVAIGNFKQHHKESLYSDAPELLEQAWQSVEEYHREFLEFFGDDEVTLPGEELNDKIAQLQEAMRKRRFAKAGVDESKSLEEMAEEAGVTEEEIRTTAQEAGADEKTVSQLFDSSKGKTEMVTPKMDLPDHLKKAPEVTALTHPRWGQTLLSTYSQFRRMLEAEDWQSMENSHKLVRQYLEDPTINAFVWHRLAQQYPHQLEIVLQTVLERPDFQLERDLDALLQENDKPLEPDLPDTASVPVHLDNLFQEALAEVSKSNSKSKRKKKKKKPQGFQ